VSEVEVDGDVVTCRLQLFGLGLAVLADEEGRTLALRSEVGWLALPSVVAKTALGGVLGGTQHKQSKQKNEVSHGALYIILVIGAAGQFFKNKRNSKEIYSKSTNDAFETLPVHRHQALKSLHYLSHLLTVPQQNLLGLLTTAVLRPILYLSLDDLHLGTYLGQLCTYQHPLLLYLVLLVEELD